ncbi:MAG: hypothetical protein H6718_36355 [Polyangiaceae bacterium]|nr:hypothetical protein [Myxococcales bacterium]MCB9590935.1 hypothetical protein [Polyangiaceae bacterium]MCB9609642.1 hypothetical protein [Polyangiaceae bacterium]
MSVGADAADPNWTAPQDLEVEFCREGSCVTAFIAEGTRACQFHGESPPLDMYCSLTVDEWSHLWVSAFWSWQGRKVQEGEMWRLTLRDSSGVELDSQGGQTVVTSEARAGEIRQCYPVTEFR